MWVKKNLGLEKCCLKKCASEKNWVPKNLGQKKKFGPKDWVQKIYWTKQILGPKTILGSKTILGPKKT